MPVLRHGAAIAVLLLLAACAGPERERSAPEPVAAADPATCRTEADRAVVARTSYVATEEGALAMMLGAGVQASVLVCGSSEQGCTLDHDAIRTADLEKTWQNAYAACMGTAAP